MPAVSELLEFDILELDRHRLAGTELESEKTAEIEVTFFHVSQIGAFDSVDFENDTVSLSKDSIFVPLARRFHFGGLSEVGRSAFAGRVDDRLLAVGRKQFRRLCRKP